MAALTMSAPPTSATSRVEYFLNRLRPATKYAHRAGAERTTRYHQSGPRNLVTQSPPQSRRVVSRISAFNGHGSALATCSAANRDAIRSRCRRRRAGWRDFETDGPCGLEINNQLK